LLLVVDGQPGLIRDSRCTVMSSGPLDTFGSSRVQIHAR